MAVRAQAPEIALVILAAVGQRMTVINDLGGRIRAYGADGETLQYPIAAIHRAPPGQP